MPNLLFHERGDLPRWLNHLLAHALPLALALAGMGNAVQMLLTVYVGWELAAVAHVVPILSMWLMAVSLWLGGLLYAWGVFHEFKMQPLPKSRALVQAGLVFMAVGWTARGVALFMAPANEGTSILTSFLVAAGLLLTLVASVLSAKSLQYDVETKVRPQRSLAALLASLTGDEEGAPR